MTEFVKYSWLKGDEDDRKLSQFLLRNFCKGIAITNTILLFTFFARFRTYRNSNLALWHIPATLLGVYNATLGT